MQPADIVCLFCRCLFCGYVTQDSLHSTFLFRGGIPGTSSNLVLSGDERINCCRSQVTSTSQKREFWLCLVRKLWRFLATRLHTPPTITSPHSQRPNSLRRSRPRDRSVADSPKRNRNWVALVQIMRLGFTVTWFASASTFEKYINKLWSRIFPNHVGYKSERKNEINVFLNLLTSKIRSGVETKLCLHNRPTTSSPASPLSKTEFVSIPNHNHHGRN